MISGTVVLGVIDWFATHGRELAKAGWEVRFRFASATDREKGKLILELDAGLAAAMLTFWNRGEVQALILDVQQKNEISLDDRRIREKEHVGSLLDGYLQAFETVLESLRRG